MAEMGRNRKPILYPSVDALWSFHFHFVLNTKRWSISCCHRLNASELTMTMRTTTAYSVHHHSPSLLLSHRRRKEYVRIVCLTAYPSASNRSATRCLLLSLQCSTVSTVSWIDARNSFVRKCGSTEKQKKRLRNERRWLLRMRLTIHYLRRIQSKQYKTWFHCV